MSARLLVACALAALGAAAATPAVAQDATTLRGPWLGAGIGTASAQVNCDLCASDRNGGLSGYVAGGLRVAPNLHAGLELAGWFDNTEGVSQRLMLYGASLWWHPQPTPVSSRSTPVSSRSAPVSSCSAPVIPSAARDLVGRPRTAATFWNGREGPSLRSG